MEAGDVWRWDQARCITVAPSSAGGMFLRAEPSLAFSLRTSRYLWDVGRIQVENIFVSLFLCRKEIFLPLYLTLERYIHVCNISDLSYSGLYNYIYVVITLDLGRHNTLKIILGILCIDLRNIINQLQCRVVCCMLYVTVKTKYKAELLTWWL